MYYNDEYWKDIEEVLNGIKNTDKLRNKTILITGCTGMVCSAIVESFAWLNKHEKMNIHMILAGRDKQKIDSRFREVLSPDEYEFYQFDANIDTEMDLKIDYIIHGASNANPRAYVESPVETLLGNIIGMNDVLKLAKKNNGARVLYVSSSEVYGNSAERLNVPYKEEDYGFIDVLNPRACYPNGKRAAETLCACYAKEYNTDVVIVRLGHIYGPSIQTYDTRASACFTRDAKAGINIVMKSAGNQLRSYCYTLDCASGIITVLLEGKTGEAYNISNRDSIVSIRDLACELAAAAGVKVVFENPTDIEKSGYNLMSNSSLVSEKIESLGWRAVFNLREGVQRTLRYYQ